MRKIAEQLYASMQKDLQACKNKAFDQEQEIESRSQICKSYWHRLQIELKDHKFNNEEEEINFFKTIKPLFTAEIEYYNLLYHAHLFKPLIGCEELQRFWLRESLRLEKFTESHYEFYQYHSNKEISRDEIYFTRRHTSHPVAIEGSLEGQTSTSHDHLLTELIALEKYCRYVQMQIEELNNTEKNGN